MSCPPSITNQMNAAPARKGKASTTSRRNMRVDSIISVGSRRRTKAIVEASVTGWRAMAWPAIQLWPAASASRRPTLSAATTTTNATPAGERTNAAMSKLLITGSPEASTMRRPTQVTSGAKIAKPRSCMST